MKNQDSEMKKMRFSDDPKKNDNKKKSPSNPRTSRPSIISNYSFVSLSEVTEGSLQVWRTLPEKIRQDPSLASFRQEHERLHGEFLSFFFDIFVLTTWKEDAATNFPLWRESMFRSNLFGITFPRYSSFLEKNLRPLKKISVKSIHRSLHFVSLLILN